MKTIKQIATELSVSKQAVFKKIDNLGLRSKLTKNGNQFTVDEATETLIKQGFSETERKPVDDNETTTVDTLIAMLQKELDHKNKVIEEQAKTIENLTAAVASAQALHAGTIQTQLLDHADHAADPEEKPKKKFKLAWWK